MLLQRKDARWQPRQTLDMTTKRLLALLLVAVAVTVTFARTRRSADRDTATQTFDVTGVVTAAPADGRVTVAHEAIRGYMPAMTMPFVLGAGTPPLAPGDRVTFTLRVASEWSRAENFVVVGRDASVAGATSATETPARDRLKKGDALPPFSLTTHRNEPFTLADLRGRLTAVTFVFTRCPMPEFCPLMVKRFQQLQREVEREPELRDVRLVSVTLDPAFDTPTVLDAYAKAMGANPERWRFVTGEPPAVARLTKAFSIHVEQNGVLLDHTLATAVVDADGRVAEIWRGNGWKVSELLDVLHQEARRAPGAATNLP